MIARISILLLLFFGSFSAIAVAGERSEGSALADERTWSDEQCMGEGEYTALSFSPVRHRLDEGGGVWVWELRAGTWIADWDFTAKTAEKSSEISGKALGFIGPAVELRFNDRFSIEAAYQYNMGGDIAAHVVSAGVAYKLFPPETMDERYERLTVDFGVCYGALDIGIGGFPGDFDNSVGFYGGVQYIVELGERFELNVGIQARSLKFDFNPDDDVTEYNTSIGGLGGVTSFHILGIAYKF